MVQLAEPVRLADVKPAEPSVPLPPGDYPLEVFDSELVETKAGGQMLKFKFRVDSGTGSGRFVWMNYNIVNANPKAVEIAQRDLKALCEACGHHGDLTDTEDLHGIVFMATLKIRKSEGYNPQNEIGDYKSMGARPGAPSADPLQAAADYAQSSGGTRKRNPPNWG